MPTRWHIILLLFLLTLLFAGSQSAWSKAQNTEGMTSRLTLPPPPSGHFPLHNTGIP